jgi:hypothetical protein
MAFQAAIIKKQKKKADLLLIFDIYLGFSDQPKTTPFPPFKQGKFLTTPR